MNTYFINSQWIYHEILLIFEHITNSHIEQRLTKVMQDIIVRHKLKKRLYVFTNNNVFNNLTLHIELIQLLRTSRLFEKINTNVRDVKRMFCLAHVIQLILQKLLNKIKIKFNTNFKTIWNDKQNKTTMKKKEKKMLYILTKIRTYFTW